MTDDGNLSYVAGESIRLSGHYIDTDVETSFLGFNVVGNNRNLYYSHPTFEFWGAFPIIDTVNKLQNQQLSTCGSIGRTTVEYADTRIHTIHWTDTVGHCLYQVAVGPVDQPFSEYEVYETADTSLNYIGLNYGDKRACRVRALCCVDTLSVWRSWSDTVQFYRPYYKLSLFSSDMSMGNVSGYGLHEQNGEVAFSAIPKNRYVFDRWNDGNTDNPRTITLVCDTSFTAYFSPLPDTDSVAIVTADNINLTISPNPADNEISIRSLDIVYSVQFFDMQGRLLLTENIDSQTFTIDVSSLPKGVLLLRASTSQGTVYGKIVHR